ncbi:LacI family DNA-binding transcriptional regulator [Luteipulveratus mongoliensis]|uniref:HTH lacI-type domain-containing protein n=1 Tax=Luteipulveratus mongoliensis TaxID=571913 RepID=A0A0K1JK05_9MICO|nr:LacI family DNA-binding transcriptional regulator [Luteipulveratus mongoliensis]AKU16905.1 hypothetical protein VV02_15250 [Luteipulveratus mongoliensis]
MATETPERPAVRPRGVAPTLAQVAQHAGVSLKTASRALNGEAHVSPDKQTRVLDAARELGYQLNRTASMLARGVDSHVVGLITGDIANPFYSALAKGVEQELRAWDGQLTVASSDEEPDRERALVHELVTRHVRAVILVSTLDDHQAMRDVQSRGIPVVFVDRVGVGIEADSVVIDNRGGSRTAVEHLIAGGHTSIGFIGDLSRLPSDRERFEGYVETMRAAGLDPTRAVRRGAHSVQAAAEAAHSLLTQDQPPTAIFAGNNRITIGSLQAMNELSVEPALVGFDDFELGDLLGITVVAHSPVEMGRTAARLAIEATERRRTGATSVTLETTLLARGSGERRP